MTTASCRLHANDLRPLARDTATEEYAATLFEAVERNDLVKARLALASRPDTVRITGASGRSALHVAAQRGLPHMVILLLANRAEIDAVDEGGKAPVELAATAGHAHVVSVLLGRGAAIPANLAAGAAIHPFSPPG